MIKVSKSRSRRNDYGLAQGAWLLEMANIRGAQR
jgi:hypothetical protein